MYADVKLIINEPELRRSYNLLQSLEVLEQFIQAGTLCCLFHISWTAVNEMCFLWLFQDLDLNTTGFMQLYAWYSWPNVVFCFFGGFLIDRVFGIRYKFCMLFVTGFFLSSLRRKNSEGPVC